jgi:hypothetical protein
MTDFDPTKPVRQRNGRAATIHVMNLRVVANGNIPLPIFAEVEREDGGWAGQMYRADGTVPYAGGDGDRYNLVNIPERSSVWVTARLPSDVKRGVRWTPFTKQEAMAFSPTHAAIELIFEGDEFIEAKYHRS